MSATLNNFIAIVANLLASIFYWIIDFFEMIIDAVGWNTIAVILLVVLLIKLVSR